MPKSDAVLLECPEDGVAVVTLNRPERLNALDQAAKETLSAIWQEAEASPQIRAVVLRGAGARAFCAGSDFKDMAERGGTVDTQLLANALPGVGHTLSKPVVAALHGHVIGTGFSLAIHSDFRIAAPGTRFAFPEVQHGMLSAFSAITLPGLVGEALALDIMLSGRPVGAEEALRIGLAGEISPDPYGRAMEMARSLAEGDPAAMRWTKNLILAERNRRLRRHWAMVQDARADVDGSRASRDTIRRFAGSVGS